MKYSSMKKESRFIYVPLFLHFVLAATVQFHSDLVASPINFPDTTKTVIPREQTIPFYNRNRAGISPGDTLVMYPKRELPNGYIVDYPREQRFEARILKGQKYAAFVFPRGITSTDTSGIVSPVKLCVGTVRSVELKWAVYALQVDTSNDHLLRSMDIHEMIRRLSAPTNRLKCLMMVYAGYLQLKLAKYEDARVCLREAIVLDSSQRSSMYYDMACSYARENKTHDALEWLRRAFESGYDKYIHALRDDSDLVSIRQLPEFREIVTARFAHKRAVLLDSIKAHPNDAGRFYFQIGATYLEQADIDSFFVAFETALKEGFYPRLSLFIENEYSLVKNDPRVDALLEKYAEQNPYRISSEFESALKPRTVRRVELNQHIDGFIRCPKLIELRIMHSARGELPPEIANMKSLRILRYVYCGFKNFQSAITQCTALDTLTADKGLSKTLPVNFGDLVNLKQLKLCRGRLESLPPSFSSLSHLADLSFSGNSFSSFPEEILNLTHLTSLDISRNSISEIPSDLQKLSSLQKLDLADNRITLVPNSISDLRQLKDLDLSLNCLSSLPEGITRLQQLEQLDLSFNELKKLPRSLGNLHSLRNLNVYGNQLDSVEIQTLRILLPHCKIVGDQQNVFQKQKIAGGKSFYDTAFGVSFSYPASFSLVTKKSGEDSSERIIELSHRNIYEQEIDSVTYKFPTDATLTIRFSWDGFDEIAGDAGFGESERLHDANGGDDSDSTPPALWVSEGRQGMEEDVSVVSYDGWRGFYGTNFTGTFGESDSGQGSGYQGLHEFYVALARKRIDHGMSVSISFFNENYEDDDVFRSVLSSFQFHRRKDK